MSKWSWLPHPHHFEFTVIMCCNSMKVDPEQWPWDAFEWMLYSIQYALLYERAGFVRIVRGDKYTIPFFRQPREGSL